MRTVCIYLCQHNVQHLFSPETTAMRQIYLNSIHLCFDLCCVEKWVRGVFVVFLLTAADDVTTDEPRSPSPQPLTWPIFFFCVAIGQDEDFTHPSSSHLQLQLNMWVFERKQNVLYGCMFVCLAVCTGNEPKRFFFVFFFACMRAFFLFFFLPAIFFFC